MKIKTFGPVDERSRAQLERCMSAGDAEFGVLCADHHPGYSQPIGGAIAYEGFVSPSDLPTPAKYAIGAGSGVLLYSWLLLGGRTRRAAAPRLQLDAGG